MDKLGHWASRALTLVTRALESFAHDRGHRLAAQIAYHVLFSLFPLALVVTAVLGLVFGDDEARQRVVDFLRANFPLLDRQSSTDIASAVRGVTTGATALGAGAAVVLVWSASAMMAATRDALNVAWGAQDRRPFFRGKLVDLLLVALVALTIAASFALTVAASAADDLGLGGLRDGGFFVSFPVSLAAFALIYRVVPSATTRLADIWPGAVLAALLFEALKGMFRTYVENFASYNVVYGSVAAVAIFLVFVFLAANIMVLGAEAASQWPAVARGEHDDEEDQPWQVRLKRFVLGLFVRDPHRDGG